MTEKSIQDLDRNLKVDAEISADGMVFYDVRRAPFKIYGLYDPKNENVFKRMPTNAASKVSEGVYGLSFNTAGGRVRFATSSAHIAIKAQMPKVTHFSHMPLTGTSGFDIYEDFPDGKPSKYVKTFTPPYFMTHGFDSKISLPSACLRYFTINFPSYNRLDSLYIGVDEGAYIGEGLTYPDIPPIVYYGSSITQGGCSSRPGNTYQNMICRVLPVDYINLGFSGNGLAEDSMVDYICSLDMSVFVCDYDYNAPTEEHLRATHKKMYEKIRAAHPTVPYIIMSKPDFHQTIALDGTVMNNAARREIIYNTYLHAKSRGDENVYFIDGEKIFEGEYRHHCTVDGTHPNDLGFAHMAKALLPIIRRHFRGRI